MSEFLAMGGYGFYVWGSFGTTAVVIALELVALRARRRTILAEARHATPDSLSAATGGVL